MLHVHAGEEGSGPWLHRRGTRAIRVQRILYNGHNPQATGERGRVSDVVSVFQGLDTAYQKKTIKLLQSKHSQVYLA